MTSPFLTAGLLNDIPSVTHGFFTADYTISTAIYSDPLSTDIPETLARAAFDLTGEKVPVVCVKQEHTADVTVLTDPWSLDQAPVADAIVTDRPDIALCIVTADCAPVLLCEPDSGIIGAAHAGWRGALDEIVLKTINAMEKLGADRKRLRAAVGPCIGPESYEVDRAFFDRFLSKASENKQFFKETADPNHPLFDLSSFVASPLEGEEIPVEKIPQDTAVDTRFHSYRRAFLSKKTTDKRHFSMICRRAS